MCVCVYHCVKPRQPTDGGICWFKDCVPLPFPMLKVSWGHVSVPEISTWPLLDSNFLERKYCARVVASLRHCLASTTSMHWRWMIMIKVHRHIYLDMTPYYKNIEKKIPFWMQAHEASVMAECPPLLPSTAPVMLRLSAATHWSGIASQTSSHKVTVVVFIGQWMAVMSCNEFREDNKKMIRKRNLFIERLSSNGQGAEQGNKKQQQKDFS